MSVNVSEMSGIGFYGQAKKVLQNAKYECFPSSDSETDNYLFCLVYAIDYIFREFVSDFENVLSQNAASPSDFENLLSQFEHLHIQTGNKSNLTSINLGKMKSHIESHMGMIRESNEDTSDGENIVEEKQMEDVIDELCDIGVVFFEEGSGNIFINTTKKCIESASMVL